MSSNLSILNFSSAGLGLPETTEEDYLRAQALLTYPGKYLKIAARLERPRTIHIKFRAAAQALKGNYVKVDPIMERPVDLYLKIKVGFPPPAERYVRAAASFAVSQALYIRAAVRFKQDWAYLKVRATLVRTPILTDVPDAAGTDQVGLVSRQYLSLASVKKEI